ncbi:unnamed protein product [Spodoptera littoralis]|uniref:PDZ domain-containing protein n=1 Tax=Spodoptera littoralis TaxID=7109 RepID=A0A9P0I8D0_SPOLI|nr:unnamed protein product [Spodoptera littoralis]CAH1641907.1 unnamed protein product [Spodoptera littoralis]
MGNTICGGPVLQGSSYRDRILEVDGVCVRSAQHERAVQLIKAAGDTVTLTVQSLLAWVTRSSILRYKNTDSSDVEQSTPPTSPTPSKKDGKKSPAPPLPQKTPQHEIKITVTSEADVEKEATDSEKPVESDPPPAPAKVVYSDSESSDEEDERELQGRTYSDKGVEIDRASAGAVKRSKEEKEADPEEEDDFGYTTKYGSHNLRSLATDRKRGPTDGEHDGWLAARPEPDSSVRRVAFRALLKEPSDHHRWGLTGLMLIRSRGEPNGLPGLWLEAQEKERGGF